MKIAIAAGLALALAAPAGAADLENDDQKVLYVLGHALARNITQFDLSKEELGIVSEGLSDGVLGKEPQVELEKYGPQIQALAQKRTAAVAAKEKAAGKGFLEKAANEKGAVKTESGLIYKELEAGTGESPEGTSRVKVHYEGTLRDGSTFDSSRARGEPAEFNLNEVIGCWTEGVQKMKVGGKAELVCPSEIAYGDRGVPPRIKPGAALEFEVELLEIVEP